MGARVKSKKLLNTKIWRLGLDRMQKFDLKSKKGVGQKNKWGAGACEMYLLHEDTMEKSKTKISCSLFFNKINCHKPNWEESY